MLATLLITSEGGFIEVEGSYRLGECPTGRAYLDTEMLRRVVYDEEKRLDCDLTFCERGTKATFRYFRVQRYKGEMIAVYLEE